MKPKLGRGIAAAITAVVGIVVLANFFVRNASLRALQSTLLDWVMLLAAVALLLGVLNIVRTHARKIGQRGEGWPYSIVLLAAVAAVLFFGIRSAAPGPAAPSVDWIFRNILVPLQATIFALLAFFVAFAAYRALRARNLESLILVVTALIVLVGQIPFAGDLWTALPRVKEWILAVPSTAGARGILLGAALGAVATGLRVLLGTDRPHAR